MRAARLLFHVVDTARMRGLIQACGGGSEVWGCKMLVSGTCSHPIAMARARPHSWRLTVRMARNMTINVPRRGQANYGELGYGANGKKSSANPGKVDSLEGVKTQQVSLP